jgi:hypothetical protein
MLKELLDSVLHITEKDTSSSRASSYTINEEKTYASETLWKTFIANLFVCVNFLVQHCKRKNVRAAVNDSASREKKP